MELKLYKDSFDGKQLFYGYLSGYRVYVNHMLVERLKKNINKQVADILISLPIQNCDVVEIDENTIVLVPGDKILYYFGHNYYEIVGVEGENWKTRTRNKNSRLILASGKVKLYCQYTEENEDGEEETRNMVVLLHPDGKKDYIPDEKILEYV